MKFKSIVKSFLPEIVLQKRIELINKRLLNKLIHSRDHTLYSKEIDYVLSVGVPLAIPYRDIHEKYDKNNILIHCDGGGCLLFFIK